MPDELVRKGGRYCTPPQIEAGLRALVRNGGAVSATARELGVPYNTARSWQRRHRERLEQIRVEMGPELEAQAVAGFQAFVHRAEQAKIAALEATVENLAADRDAAEQFIADVEAYRAAVASGDSAALPPSAPKRRVADTAKTLQHIAVAQGIGVQKILELTSRPTQIVEHRSMSDIMARLQSLGATVIDGTAAEEDAAILPSPTVVAPTAALPSEATAHGTRSDQQA